MKLEQGYVFTHVCDSVHKGEGGIPACIAGDIPACLAAGLQWGGIPACLAGFQAHTQGEVEGSGQGAGSPEGGGIDNGDEHGVTLSIMLSCLLVALSPLFIGLHSQCLLTSHLSPVWLIIPGPLTWLISGMTWNTMGC